MTALIGAVFLASLLGSLHCVGMCGAFVAFAVGADPERGGRASLHAAYNLGRLSTYVALGVIAGLVGRAVDLTGEAAGLQRVAASIAGAMMVGFGLIVLLRLRGVRLPRAPLPPGLRRVTERGHRFAAGRTPGVRALLVGMLTTLLPCGWLYAFVITAAGTGSPWWGGVTMLVFWAGTLPALVAVGAGASRVAGALGKRLPLATTVLLIGVGMWTLFGRLAMPAMAEHAPEATAVADTAALIEQVEQATPLCCQPAAADAPTHAPDEHDAK
jgi:sulfite exporter TauE/SafE